MICNKTEDGYPTKEALKRIKNWDWLKHHNLIEFLDFIKSLWQWEDRFVLRGKQVLKLYLSTGGWSGNESIIDALHNNFFWTAFWEKSIRGGHYWFKIDLKNLYSKRQK